MDKGKKIKLTIIIIIIVILYIVFALFVNNWKVSSSDNYILVGDYLILHEDRGKLYQVKKVTDDVLKQSYSVYDGNEFTDVYNLQFVSNKWVFFDKNYKELDLDDFKFAYSGNAKVSDINYSKAGYDDNDEDILSEVLNLQDSEQKRIFTSTLSKVSFDFDKDGQEETVYTTTNVSLTSQNYAFKSYMFLVRNGKVLDVKEADTNTFSVMEVLDVDDDKKYDIIVGRNIVDVAMFDDCYQMYRIENDKLKLVQDCKFDDEK